MSSIHSLGMKPGSSSSVVRLTVEVDVGGPWSPDCTVEQIVEQTTREARNYLDLLVHSGGKCHECGKELERPNPRVRILDAEAVSVITHAQRK